MVHEMKLKVKAISYFSLTVTQVVMLLFVYWPTQHTIKSD